MLKNIIKYIKKTSVNYKNWKKDLTSKPKWDFSTIQTATDSIQSELKHAYAVSQFKIALGIINLCLVLFMAFFWFSNEKDFDKVIGLSFSSLIGLFTLHDGLAYKKDLLDKIEDQIATISNEKYAEQCQAIFFDIVKKQLG